MISGKIGVFDSGFGGLTVLSELLSAMPGYDYLYLGDNARYPYGNRGFDTVLEFTTEAVEYLFSCGCPLVVVACNTASSKALRTIQQKHLPIYRPDRRVLGMVRPSAEVLADLPPGAIPGVTEPGNAEGTVAILATPGTVASGSFVIELEKLAPKLRVIQQACPLWVPLVENGELEGPGCDFFIHKYLDPILAGPDVPQKILLACTHYPLLLPRIRAVVGEKIQILTQGAIIAERLADWLGRHPEMAGRLSTGGTREYLTTDDSARFDELASMFLSTAIKSEHVHLPRFVPPFRGL
jgi:glutamate racemase